MTYNANSVQPSDAARWGAIVGGAILGLVLIIVALIVLFSTVSRWNSRQEAENRVKVSQTEIKNQSQRVLIAQQKAQIREEEAIGVRKAQDHIAKTLTPLYVQYEMTQVLNEIAHSGNNNSIVYLPSGPNGIPLVDDVSVNKVGNGG